MKGRDRCMFCTIILISLIVSPFVFDEKFNRYSDVITYLSIMIGFKIASLSILYNSPLRKTLYDRKIKLYETELHRIKGMFQYSVFFEVYSVMLLFILPVEIISLSHFVIGRHLIVFPILIGSVFCFYKVFNELLTVFSYPTN
jgi:hypothetical protein